MEKKKRVTFRGYSFFPAESEGFKPPIPERGIPDFESSAIDHSANSPLADAKVVKFFEIAKLLWIFFVTFAS